MQFSPVLSPLTRSLVYLYLDPGSGSIIIQLAIAAALGLGIVLRTQWGKIRKLFSKKNKDNEEADSEE